MVKPDFIVYSVDKRPRLAVEVKFRPGATEEWATRFYRNLRSHSTIPDTDYFMLVVPENAYVWHVAPGSEHRRPDFTVPTKELIEPFWKPSSTPATSGEGLEIATGAWLSNLTTLPKSELKTQPRWFESSGLIDRISGGYIERP